MKRNKPEKKLENWLKNNLEIFNPFYKLIGTQFRYKWQGDCGKRYNQIDILAEDSSNDNTPVLIEVKMKANVYSLEKQLKYYMEKWPTKCYGVIAALHITKNLQKALLPLDIELWDLSEYYNKRR